MDKLKKFKNFVKKHKKKFKLEEFGIEALVVLSTILMAYFTFQIFQLYTYPHGNLGTLPSKYTIFAYDWNPRLNNPFETDLKSQVGLAYYVQLANAEQTMLPSEVTQSLQPFSFSSKTLAYVWVEDRVEPVILLKFDKIQKQKAVEFADNYQRNDWLLGIKKNVFIFTQSEQSLKNMTVASKKVSEDPQYLDAASNLQSQSYAQFYVNHELLNQFLRQKQTRFGFLTYTPFILERFGVTVGTIIPDREGVYLNTYTNPGVANKEPFPHSRVNFKADLLQEKLIPADPLFLVSGSDLTQRFYKFLEGSKQAQENSSWISKSLNNVLTTYNLDQDIVTAINQIFTNEFLIAGYPEGDFVLAFDSLKSKDQKKLISQLDKLTQYFNPRTISYLLPDGQVGRQLVPNEDVSHTEFNDLIQFDFTEIETTLFLKEVGEYTLVSNFEIPEETPGTSLDKVSKILSIADEVVELSPEFIYPQLQNYLDPYEVPHITTATNFFNDGIQTVSLLTWPIK